MDKTKIEKIEKEFYRSNLRAFTSYALYVLCFVAGGAIAFYWLKEALMEAALMEAALVKEALVED